ncbi:MAG: tetratricopeptide repeat protein [Mariprofundaceae bacterium]|nr:tetratricopeptide repeat protein [Mariprofundaceae bacterium]
MFLYTKNLNKSPFLLGFLAVLCYFPFSCLAASPLNKADQKEFTQAIEDFRFSDFDAAVLTFKALLLRHPNDARISEYLGRAYEESKRYDDAVSLYGQWLKQTDDQKSQTARFAWIGMANALIKLKRDESGSRSLAQWIAYHPNDAVASVLYGSTLLRMKRYDDSAKLWDSMLANTSMASKDQAAAHYYKAFLAYNRGDLLAQRRHATLSLQKDPTGPYAQAAQQFMDAKPARKLGLTASASVVLGYTSNVELLPDFTAPLAGGSKADTTTQPVVSLLYNLEKFSVGYVFNGNFHAKRNDLDLAYHSMYGLWAYGLWFAMPRVEYITLGNAFLTNSFGGDMGWGNGDLRLTYSLRYNQYTKNLNGTNLRHLGGISNTFKGEGFWQKDAFIFSANAALSQLISTGDALYAKSDSYWQSGVAGSLGWSRDAWHMQGLASVYYRKYKEAAPVSPLLVRQDSNINMSADLSWLLLEHTNYLMRLTSNIGWQKNNSNDTSKGYKEWHVGSGMQVDW